MRCRGAGARCKTLTSIQVEEVDPLLFLNPSTPLPALAMTPAEPPEVAVNGQTRQVDLPQQRLPRPKKGGLVKAGLARLGLVGAGRSWLVLVGDG